MLLGDAAADESTVERRRYMQHVPSLLRHSTTTVRGYSTV